MTFALPPDNTGKVYITKGGYVIPFVEGRIGHVDYCPFENDDMQNAREFRKGLGDCDNSQLGWNWRDDGTCTIHGDLTIVKEYPYTFNQTLPNGFRWKGGYPRLQKVSIGDHYMGMPSGTWYKCESESEARSFGNIDSLRIVAEQIVVDKSTESQKQQAIDLSTAKKGDWFVTNDGHAIEYLRPCEINSHELSYRNGLKLIWENDGTILMHIAEEAEDLRIIGRCPTQYTPVLPQGYEWAHGYPKFEKVVVGKTYLANEGYVWTPKNPLACPMEVILDKRIQVKKVDKIDLTPQPETVQSTEVAEASTTPILNFKHPESKCFVLASGRVVKIHRTPLGTYYSNCVKDMTGSPLIFNSCGSVILSKEAQSYKECKVIREYTDKLNPEFPNPPKGYKWKHGFPKLTEVGENELYMNELCHDSVASGSAHPSKEWLCLIPDVGLKPYETMKDYTTNGYRPKVTIDLEDIKYNSELLDIVHRSIGVYDAPVNSSESQEKEEEEMKKETAVAVGKSVGSFAWRTLNYMYLETATEIGKRLGRSVRYAVFFATVATGAGLYFAPDTTKGIIKSCLPKISISISAPEIVK